ncbi:BREX-2 system adenine-specific DNA-methyltransferase PglX [Planomonospora sp. ID91781]|uniref:BREX-2 system adenine-specific DNA-methyltransferase PglX n=1 Tax=Planomonospora sp. ID91781 TaxID=2738135 RepID=UPI0018C40695|nr:BREX-2 system adenine-specific DNA-methyltransferase PglX [Planomonospora sp. ID91781]MBG0825177.1 BREX-2 system adenine-specific DNA-methyltransferase PglX [Planomonospora sp. ID91781]
MSVISAALLKDLQQQARRVADDLREQAGRIPEIGDRLKEMHRRAGGIGRTGESWNDWLIAQSAQAASAWVVACAFIRFCEDNDLTTHRWIASRDVAGLATSEAADAEAAWIQRNPRLTAREWLRESFTWLRSTRAGHALFPDSDFVWWWDLSADQAEELIALFRRRDAEGVRLAHDGFHSPDLDTRFLGDLYQDLSEHIRKRYALLQTPVFVEEFILERVLDPALDDFGLEGLRLIDPTCGSGHFLLGAFDRLLEEWNTRKPGMDERVRVQKVLDAVHGVDINPTATAITKFRLMVAALKACGVTRLDGPDVPALSLNIATGDTLLYGGGRAAGGGRQMTLDVLENDPLASHLYAWEDIDHFPGILDYGRYHVVVGNPPYITVKDKALNQAYRDRYTTCSGTYALSVPFAELFFRLAVKDNDRPGHVGQITANSFMKREFGKKLIEEFFAHKVDLTHVIDTSGAYIPGHGTPTVILIGKNRDRNRLGEIRAVLGVRGEPAQPADPSQGLVWIAIIESISHGRADGSYVSLVSLPRERFSSHPWSLSGGGAADLKLLIEAGCSPLLSCVEAPVGRAIRAGADDVFVRSRLAFGMSGASVDLLKPVMAGEVVRDWSASPIEFIWYPYRDGVVDSSVKSELWPFRALLAARRTFQGDMAAAGLKWWEYMQHTASAYATPLSITFGEVATHNHFVLDRGGKVFKQTAPVIKLPEGATEDDHLRLLGLLNSSTACFWLKQVCHDKGNRGEGGGITSAAWERFAQFNSTNVAKFPLPDGAPLEKARRLDALAQQLATLTPQAVCARAVPSHEALAEARKRHDAVRAEMIAVQEELDWEVYRLYGILDENLTYHGDDLPGLALGERAFEIVLGARVLDGEDDTQWFERHGSTPIRDVPADWPEPYRDLVRRRIEVIGDRPLIRLVEAPECKRRWRSEPYEDARAEALRTWLLDRLEAEEIWFDGGREHGTPRTLSVAQLADLVRTDADFRQVMDLYVGRPDHDLTTELTALLKDEHVPYLAALRHTPTGLLKRRDWEEVWARQRREDAGEKVEIDVPPKYTPKDFANPSYWRHRGKLDVPKERFVGYPGAQRENDATPVLGWAGWDHLQRATALANTLIEREYPAGDGRAVPLLAGLAELEPWLHQWHHEYADLYAGSPADYFTAWLDGQLAERGLTREALADWRPEAGRRGGRAADPAKKSAAKKSTVDTDTAADAARKES